MKKEFLGINFYTHLLTARSPKSVNNLKRKSLDPCFTDSYIIHWPRKTVGTDFISLENCGYPDTSKFYIVLITAVQCGNELNQLFIFFPYEFPTPGKKAEDSLKWETNPMLLGLFGKPM